MYSKELLKGTLKPIILQLLSEKEQMYGYEIVQAVKSRSGDKIIIKEGSLYPILHSLKAEGVLKTQTQIVANRTRKYYSLSVKGKKKSREILAELKDFIGTVQNIINPQTSFS